MDNAHGNKTTRRTSLWYWIAYEKEKIESRRSGAVPGLVVDLHAEDSWDDGAGVD